MVPIAARIRAAAALPLSAAFLLAALAVPAQAAAPAAQTQSQTAPSSASPPASAEKAAVLLARAAADPGQAKALAEEGSKAAFFCANCHGDGGISRYPEVPNLAAQNPAYLLGQIEAFLSGRRKDEFMQGLMKVLSERDKAAIASYYATARPVPAGPPGTAKGAELFAQLCATCHQPDARGAETFPRLAGQQPEYIRRSLRRYLNQSGERIYAPMTAAVTRLGAQNIDTMADYLAGLK
jgi:cytochrome c553